MRCRVICAAVCLLLGSSTASLARADTSRAALGPGFAVNSFEPTPAGDMFAAVPDAFPRLPRKGAIKLVLDSQWSTLSAERFDGRGVAVVKHQMYGHLSASVMPFRWLLLHGNVPVVLRQTGEAGSLAEYIDRDSSPRDYPQLGDVGDVRVGGRFQFGVGSRTDGNGIGAAVGGEFWAPTGAATMLTGDWKSRGLVRANVSASFGAVEGGTAPFSVSATGGYLFRHTVAMAGGLVGPGPTMGVGGSWRLKPWLLSIESVAQYSVGDDDRGGAGVKERLQGRLIASARVLIPRTRVTLGVGGGPGYWSAVGAPSWLAQFSIELVPSDAPTELLGAPPPPPPPPSPPGSPELEKPAPEPDLIDVPKAM